MFREREYVGSIGFALETLNTKTGEWLRVDWTPNWFTCEPTREQRVDEIARLKNVWDFSDCDKPCRIVEVFNLGSEDYINPISVSVIWATRQDQWKETIDVPYEL